MTIGRRERNKQEEYLIPSHYMVAIRNELDHKVKYSLEERMIVDKLLKQLNSWFNLKDLSLPYIASKINYKENMQLLLWAEEFASKEALKKFNMRNVILAKCVSPIDHRPLLKLHVPGLENKKPSLAVGGLVKLVPTNDSKTFETKIVDTDSKANLIFLDKFNNAIYNFINTNQTFDVYFKQSRCSYVRSHKALQNIEQNFKDSYLFPKREMAYNRVVISVKPKFINPSIEENVEQKNAVVNILNNTSINAPYILFGPPGTGKTSTLVEVILQIMDKFPDKQILICAPSNAACDNIGLKLIDPKYNITKEKLVRINSSCRDEDSIPKKLKPFCKINVNTRTAANKSSGRPDKNLRYKVVIATIGHIGKYEDYKPDVIIVDEAGQATEADVCVPISLLKKGGQLVLSGDPKQLGPVCLSKMGIKYGLAISMLKRLILTNPLYIDQNPMFLTMLKDNYRSHANILKVPNTRFYNSELKAKCKEIQSDFISCICLHNLTYKSKISAGYPVEFINVNFNEQRTENDTSYYNTGEIKVISALVKTLLEKEFMHVKPIEIGIITPYSLQTQKIKKSLKGVPDIEVGTTEVYQGREKRIIIISTVRSSKGLSKSVRQNLGFVASEERFNVAVTRAMAKLIIVGNHEALSLDENWKSIIDDCINNKSFFKVKPQ